MIAKPPAGPGCATMIPCSRTVSPSELLDDRSGIRPGHSSLTCEAFPFFPLGQPGAFVKTTPRPSRYTFIAIIAFRVTV